MAGSASGRRAASVLLRALLDGERHRGASAVRYLSSCGILETQCTRLPQVSTKIISKPQTRSFLNLAAPLLGGKKMEYTEAKVLAYSAEQMYDVVADVANYKLFVPWCISSKVLSCSKGVTKAELEVGFAPIVERYISEISVVPQHKIRAVCNDGKLFSHMETIWRFLPGPVGQPDTCTLNFSVSFEFKSLLHSHLANVFFDEVVKKMVVAFEKRAAKTYRSQMAGPSQRKVQVAEGS